MTEELTAATTAATSGWFTMTLDILRAVPGILLLPLTAYLGWKKLGHSVSYSLTYKFERTVARRFGSVTLTNNKDRPVPIFAIEVVVDNKFYFEIEKFNPPMILKALETVTVETKPYSKLMLDAEEWHPDPRSHSQVEIYLQVPKRVIKAKPISHPPLILLKKFRNLTAAMKLTHTHNGVVYNDNVQYAIDYVKKGESTQRTALVDVGGIICGDWEFWFNKLQTEHLRSTESVTASLKDAGFESHLKTFVVTDLTQFTAKRRSKPVKSIHHVNQRPSA